ncbi:MAG: hypothetical protein MUE85_17675 [Microscillaceae bacterium]|jgi:hypothetical protein|nr:hypothetical protein [Microscillaceae bacterium]
MKFNHSVFIFLIISLLGLGACTIYEAGVPGLNGVSDKQIRFALGTNLSTTATTASRTASQYDLIKFDKRNYISVDSIVFSARMRSAVATDSCVVELVNITDNQVVSNSILYTKSETFVWQDSRNIFSALPNKEITLGVQVRSRKGALVEGGQSFLFLYRD